MKTKDIQAGVAYATVRGEYIVPQEPVKATYQYLLIPEEDGNNKRTVIDTEANQDPENPWKGKVKADPKGSYRTGNTGIKVLAYSTLDEDGKPEGEPVEGVVQPRDIGGTWNEYLSLYGHVVKEKAVERQRKELIASTQGALKHALEDVPDEFGISFSHRRGWRNRQDTWDFSISVPVGDGSDEAKHAHAIDLAQGFAETIREIQEAWR